MFKLQKRVSSPTGFSVLRRRGFTLIELLVVIFIIGLLAAMVVVSVSSARMKARDAKRKADIKEIKTALEMYMDDYRVYPFVIEDNFGHSVEALGSVLNQDRSYLSPMPNDPLSSRKDIAWGDPGSGWTGPDSSPTDYNYVRGGGASCPANTCYGLLLYWDDGKRCKTGQNVHSGWWGTTTPLCEL